MSIRDAGLPLNAAPLIDLANVSKLPYARRTGTEAYPAVHADKRVRQQHPKTKPGVTRALFILPLFRQAPSLQIN